MNKKVQLESTMEIDLHNYTVEDGKRYLAASIMAAPIGVKEVTVIHGYHRGDAMLTMVRKNFKCRRVERKILTLNPGITILVLK